MSGWRERAACRWWPAEWWYPTRADEWNGVKRTALRICGECPVARECLVEAMRLENSNQDRRYGIWGGTTARQRQRLATSWKDTDGDGELHG